jgi:hypothetical protein
MSTRSVLALLRRLRAHGALSLGRLVRIADADDIRTLVETGLAAGTPDGLALTDEGALYSFEDEPSLESLLDRYEHGPQDARVAHLQGLLEGEPAPQISDEDHLPPHPALSRDWRSL